MLLTAVALFFGALAFSLLFTRKVRNYAVARLFLDNIPHLKAYWAMLGLELATEALDYGVDDLDGTVDDTTRIYSMAGGPDHPTASVEILEKAIRSKGRVPVERDSGYQKRVFLES